MKNWFFLFFSLMLSFFWGCTSWPSCCLISPPEISLTGEKTSIENQIIGEYREIEPEAWLEASVLSSVSDHKKTDFSSPAGQELYQAFKIRRNLADQVRLYKTAGFLGENNQGFLEFRPLPIMKKNKEEHSRIIKIIKEENKARFTVFKNILRLNTNQVPAKEQITFFGQEFAKEQKALAQKGDWWQKDSGEWVKK